VLDLEKFITHIDNIKTPFDENKIVKILNLLKQQQITTKTAKKQTKKPTEERKELKQIREFIDEVINDGKQVIQTHRRWVSPVKIKRLEDAL
jgi:transcriptional regulator of heat shock response